LPLFTAIYELARQKSNAFYAPVENKQDSLNKANRYIAPFAPRYRWLEALKVKAAAKQAEGKP
jgi:hypothetical protein